MKQLRFHLFLFILAMALGMIGPTEAGELDDIYRLADEKKLDQAMKKLDSFLAQNPRDAQARFLQGLIFTGKSRNDDAIRVFQELGTEFPDLPEPFNNLAVLYAERGEYEKARQALVNAIRILPDYATAHENLGDIYAKLSSQSYAQALRINGNNAYVFAKLELMKKLFVLPNTPAEESVSPDVPTEQAESVDAKSFEEMSAQVADAVEPQSAYVAGPQSAYVAEPQSAYVAEPQSADVAELQSADVAEPQSAYVAELQSADVAESQSANATAPEMVVEQVVLDWAQAWSSQDADRYLSFYSDEFRFPKKFSSRNRWEKQRRRILKKAGSIRVTLTNIKITVIDENRAQARFLQSYWSRGYQDQVEKTINLEKENGAWKFTREYS